MKRIILLTMPLVLIFVLCACSAKENPGEATPGPSEEVISSVGDMSAQEEEGRGDLIEEPVPVGADQLREGVFFYDLVELSDDYGDGLSPREGALLVDDLLTDIGLYSGNGLSFEQCIYISFDELAALDSVMGRECYIYSVGIGTAEGGLMGDDYEVIHRMSVDYSGEKTAAVYEDFSGNATFALTLYADFSAGSPDGTVLTETVTLPIENGPMERFLTASILAAGLSEWTGLDFSLNNVLFEEKGIIVDWSANSTLITGLGDRELNPEFQMYDAVSLNWFMMDSLAKTFKDCFDDTTIYYCSNGEPIAFTNPEDMASQGLPELPVDQPYEGSTFYVSHAGGAQG